MRSQPRRRWPTRVGEGRSRSLKPPAFSVSSTSPALCDVSLVPEDPGLRPRASDPGPRGLQDRRVGLRSRKVRLPVWDAVPVPPSALIGSGWLSTRPMIKRETPSLPKPVAMVLRRSCIRHGSPLHSPSARRWSSLALTFENPLIGPSPRAVKTQSPRPRGASLRIPELRPRAVRRQPDQPSSSPRSVSTPPPPR